MKAQHQIARLEQLLERVRRNAAAPRAHGGAALPSGEHVVNPPPPEPVELSDDDLVAIVSDTPPEPDAATRQAVAATAALLEQHSLPASVTAPARTQTGTAPPTSETTSRGRPPGSAAMAHLPPVLSWPPERERAETDPTLPPPEPSPARLQPLPMTLVTDLPSESSWRPPAPDPTALERQRLDSSTSAEELADGEEPSVDVPVLTPPPESGHQLSPESPRSWTGTPSQSPGKLELVEEEEELEVESIPPSGPKVTESYSLPPGTEQFVQHVEFEEDVGGELELDELAEPPRVATTLMSPPPMPTSEDLAEPGVQEAHVVEGRAVEVTRRPEVPGAATPAAYANIRTAFAPRTFLELLDASLGLGLKS